jgi:hypothetical protein
MKIENAKFSSFYFHTQILVIIKLEATRTSYLYIYKVSEIFFLLEWHVNFRLYVIWNQNFDYECLERDTETTEKLVSLFEMYEEIFRTFI